MAVVGERTDNERPGEHQSPSNIDGRVSQDFVSNGGVSSIGGRDPMSGIRE